MISFCVNGQSDVDGLKNKLKTARQDTTKVNIYLKFFKSDLFYTNPKEVIDYSHKALRLSKKIAYPTGMVEAHNNLGYTYRVQSETDSALFHYNKGIEISKVNNYYKGLTNAHIGLGNTYNQLSKWDEAREEFLKVISLAESKSDSVQMGSAYNNLGNSYLNRSLFQNALENYQKSLSYGDSSIRQTALINIGVVHNMMGNKDLAREYFNKSIVYAKASNNKSYLAFIYKNLGVLEKKSGNYDESILNYNLALQHYESISDDFNISEILQNLGNVYLEKKEYPTAIGYYEKSLALQKTINHPSGICYNYLALGLTYNAMGRLSISQEYAKEAKNCSDSLNLLSYKMDAKELLALIFEKQGNLSEALRYQKEFKKLSDTINVINSKENIAELETKYQTTQKEQEINLLSAENEVANLQIQKQQSLKKILIITAIFLAILIAAIYSRYTIKAKANNKLRELDTVKSNFFTNISHEFRTPLTLILNPISKLLESQKDSEIEDELKLIHRNANRLLELTNQLLDLSKLEAGKLDLRVTKGNLKNTIEMVVASFSSLVESKDIDFIVSTENLNQSAYFDTDKLQKIVTNLLSNAVKFTPAGKSIKVFASVIKDDFKISVKDSGPGIREDELYQIFNRFHQNKELASSFGGTGVGLTLTKELVNLHHGVIIVNSKLGDGAEFEVVLPINKIQYAPHEVYEADDNEIEPELIVPIETSDEELTSTLNKPIALLAEDNNELRHYIASLLKHNYSIESCSNGKDGFERAIELIPDIIISDWMMPEMNGYDLCKALKNDVRTSHIPIILLTAKADMPSKLMALEIGADDYLSKPFNNDELLIRTNNLVKQRVALRKKFSEIMHLEGSLTEIQEPDKLFLERAITIVEKHLDNSEFSVIMFQTEIGMSRSQLHRKLKALTDQSASKFIRTIRLQQAAHYFRTNGYNVSEVAYQCGFNNLSYFALCFKEKYGLTPTEYQQTKASS